MCKTDERIIHIHPRTYQKNPTTDDMDDSLQTDGYHGDIAYDDEIDDDMFC